MKKILLHDQCYSIGGPKAVLDGIINSYLGKKYSFVRIAQTEACGFNPIKALIFIVKYSRIINKEHADVIYVCGLQYSGLLMTLASKFSNVKRIILSVHGSEWDNPSKTFRKWLLMHIIEPLEIGIADSVITVCDAAQKTVKPLQGKKNNAGIVYNALPIIDYDCISVGALRQVYNIPEDKIIVVSVGRVVLAKGHQTIIEALKQMDDPSFVFVIVGEGPYLDEYRNLCKKEMEDGRLLLLGSCNRINDILRDSDIFLFATYHENHSIALLEAVSMRCAVLATRVGGNPEIIQNGYSGILIPSHDPCAIVKGLQEMKDPMKRKFFSENAYKYCSEVFSVSNTYGVLDKLFSL